MAKGTARLSSWATWGLIGHRIVRVIAIGTFLVADARSLHQQSSFSGFAQLSVCAVVGLLDACGAVATVSAAALCRTHARNVATVERFITTSQNLDHGATVAVRMIQDLELLSRGYAIPARSDLIPISRIESGLPASNDGSRSQRLLEPLRLVVYKQVRACLRVTREATQHLLVTRPLAEGLDYPSLYICNSELSAIGLSDANNDDDILYDTSGVSLKALKRLLYVFQQQRSEYFRRLSISMLVECEHEELSVSPNRVSSHRSAHDLYVGVTDHLNAHLASHECALGSLARQLAFHAHFFDEFEDELASFFENGRVSGVEAPANPTLAELQFLLAQVGRSASAATHAAQECLASSTHSQRQKASEWRPSRAQLELRLRTAKLALEQTHSSLLLSEACVARLYQSNARTAGDPANSCDEPDPSPPIECRAASQEIDPVLAEHDALPKDRDLVFEIETTAEDDVDAELTVEERRKKRAAARAQREAEERAYKEALERRKAHMRELKGVLLNVRADAIKRELPVPQSS